MTYNNIKSHIKKQIFALSLEDTISENPQSGCKTDPPPPPPPRSFRVDTMPQSTLLKLRIGMSVLL